VIPKLPQQPTLPDARPVMAADIGVRRGIRNGATASSFLDPETRQLLRTQPAGCDGPAGWFGEFVRNG
jgi:hypothetical protein